MSLVLSLLILNDLKYVAVRLLFISWKNLTWFARAELLAGITKTAIGKASNECKTFDWDWTVFKCPDTNIVFQTVVFLISVVRNNKMEPGVNSRTSDCFSLIRLWYHKLQQRFC